MMSSETRHGVETTAPPASGARHTSTVHAAPADTILGGRDRARVGARELPVPGDRA